MIGTVKEGRGGRDLLTSPLYLLYSKKGFAESLLCSANRRERTEGPVSFGFFTTSLRVNASGSTIMWRVKVGSGGGRGKREADGK